MQIVKFLLPIFFSPLLISCAALSKSEIRSEILSADISIRCNNDEDAIKYLSRVIAIDPYNERALKMRGECYYRQRKFSLAATDFKTLYETYGKTEYLLQSAKAKYEIDLYEDVVKDCLALESVSDDKSELFVAWNLLANSYFEIEKYSEAEKYYNLMLQQHKRPDIYFERATNFIHMQEYQKAKKDLLEIVVLVQDYSEVKKKLALNDEYYYTLGYCDLALRNFKEALSSFDKITNKQQFDNLEKYIDVCEKNDCNKDSR